MNLFSRDKVYPPRETIGEYTVLDVIGEGRYGICYLACKNSNRFILKQLKNRVSKKAGNNSYFEEEILRSIDHERIPGLISTISTTKFRGYVLEYKEGKTFEELIYSDNRIFQTEEIIEIGFQIIQILKYLHCCGVIHRDIRVPNTIYNKGKVYLVDFGLARWVDDQICTADIDFSYLGDFLLHLHYTSFESNKLKPKPWFEELVLPEKQFFLLKRLLGIEKRYNSIEELENDYQLLTA